MPVGERKQYRDSIISPYPQVNLITWWDWGVISSYAIFFRGFLTRLVSIVANATCFQNFRVRCHPCAGLLIPPILPLVRFPLTDWLPWCLGGFVYFSSCYRYRAYFSTDSESSRTPQLTLWSKPLPYNTVSLRLVSCYWLGLKTIKANIIKRTIPVK